MDADVIAKLERAAHVPGRDLDTADLERRVRTIRLRRNALKGIAAAVVLVAIPASVLSWHGLQDQDQGAVPPLTSQSPPAKTATGSWRTLPTGPENLSGLEAASFWTGSDVLFFTQDAATGALFNPNTNHWRQVARTNLDWRSGGALVWTGESLIVWGGVNNRPQVARAGAAYHLASDRWKPIAAAPVPPQITVGAVWTGTEMVVLTENGKVIAYNPARDTWRRGPSLPLRPRYRPAVVWTGKKMIVWGGCDAFVPQCDDTPSGGEELNDGAAYNPALNVWRPLPRSPLTARDRPDAVWTGKEVIVWGGTVSARSKGAYGAAYDPVNRTWQVIKDAPIAARSNHTMVWTGSRALVWGGVAAGTGDRFLADGAAYDPVRDTWFALPKTSIPPRDRHTAVWTGTEVIVWGGCCDRDSQLYGSGAAYRP